MHVCSFLAAYFSERYLTQLASHCYIDTCTVPSPVLIALAHKIDVIFTLCW